MELANVLRELWRRKIWVVLAALLAVFIGLSTAYRVTLIPPDLESRTKEFAAASTEILIDSGVSSLGDLRGDLAPLGLRAVIFARIVKSERVRTTIAQRADVPRGVSVEGPTVAASGPETREAPAAERARDILSEGTPYRIELDVETGVPVITVFTRAPTLREAERMANATFSAVRSYVRANERTTLKRIRNRARAEDRRAPKRLRLSRRVLVSQLGDAEGAVVNEGVDVPLALLAGVGSFLALVLLVLLGSGVAKGWRLEDAYARRRAESEQPTSEFR